MCLCMYMCGMCMCMCKNCVCVCQYVYVYVCMYVCLCVYVCVCTFACACVRTSFPNITTFVLTHWHDLLTITTDGRTYGQTDGRTLWLWPLRSTERRTDRRTYRRTYRPSCSGAVVQWCMDTSKIRISTMKAQFKKGTGINGASKMASDLGAPFLDGVSIKGALQTRAHDMWAPMKQQPATFERPIYRYKE